MKLSRLLIAELRQRKGEAALSIAAVILGVATVVAAYSITQAGEKRITEQIHNLGANLIVLPDSVRVSDYYTADFGEATLPEDYVGRLCTSHLAEKVHKMTPKLSRTIRLLDQEVILTGILPQSELPTRPGWKSGKLDQDQQHPGMDHHPTETKDPEASPPPSTARSLRPRKSRMSIKEIGRYEVLLGSEVGVMLGASSGMPLDILGERLFVANVLPETGTIDDLRVFAHLHTVQVLLGVGSVVNAIEIVGCGCHVDVAKLGRDIEAMLPGTHATTIQQIVEAQSNTMRIVRRFSIGLSAVLLVLGGMSIGNYISANVFERRREVGTLMAMGARSSQVLSLFLCKAALLGVVGGALGYGIGTLSAIWVGPLLAGVEIRPLPELWLFSIAGSGLLCLGFSMAPCLRATRIDPAAILQEA